MNSHPQPTDDEVRDALRHVMDPEMGIGIVDLGLVVAIRLLPTVLEVDLAQTSPVCPHGEAMRRECQAALSQAFPQLEARVQLKPEFPWHSGLMTPEAKGLLGW